APGSQPPAEQVAAFLYALSRYARKERRAPTTELPAHITHERRLCAARKLVRLGKKHKQAQFAEPFDELQIQRRHRMARIHDEHDADERSCRLKIHAYQPGPFGEHAFRDCTHTL